MEYLEFVYFGKGYISRIFDACRAFYRIEKQDRTLTELFMDYKKTYEELNTLLPFSPDVKGSTGSMRTNGSDRIPSHTPFGVRVY